MEEEEEEEEEEEGGRQTSQLTRFDRVTHGVQYALTVSRQGPVFTESQLFHRVQTPALSPYYGYGLVSICARR